MDKFKVTVGDETFEVTASDHQQAKYDAAEMWKGVHHKTCTTIPISKIVDSSHVHSKVVPDFPESSITSKELEKLLLKEKVN